MKCEPKFLIYHKLRRKFRQIDFHVKCLGNQYWSILWRRMKLCKNADGWSYGPPRLLAFGEHLRAFVPEFSWGDWEMDMVMIDQIRSERAVVAGRLGPKSERK